MSSDYPVGWNPYEWHDNHKIGKPRWRVKVGMFEERDVLCIAFREVNRRMETECSFFLVDEWHRLKQAILACEEMEVSNS